MKKKSRLSGLLVVGCVISVTLMSSCGGETSVGSSISVDITTPSSTTDVALTTEFIATITDDDNVGITVPSSWSDVFTLKEVGSETNLCGDGRITYNSAASPQTVTCIPEALLEETQYTISISGLTDSEGNRIDPSALAFTTGFP